MSKESRRTALRRAAGAKPKPYNVTPGGTMGPGGWMLTPDQRDRNGDATRGRVRKRRLRIPNPSNPQWA